MVETAACCQATLRLAERVQNYLRSVPGASPEQFLLEAVRKEIDHRERKLNRGKPWRSSPSQDPADSQFRPHPQDTLPTEAIHHWLCHRLLILYRQQQYRRARRGWFS
jgi:hypothetical protein